MAQDTGGSPPKAKAKSRSKNEDIFSDHPTLKKYLRGPLRTWKLYRRSMTGLVGLGIVLGFFVLAIFAPIISPYDPEFRAPAEDVFYANNVELVITESYNWSAPVGLTADTREEALIGLMLYSKDDGKALIYPVGTGVQEIEVQDPTTYSLPVGFDYIEYVHFPRVLGETSYFLVRAGQTV